MLLTLDTLMRCSPWTWFPIASTCKYIVDSSRHLVLRREDLYPRFSLFHFHFPFRGKDETSRESQNAPFLLLLISVVCAPYPSHLRVRLLVSDTLSFNLIYCLQFQLYRIILPCIPLSHLVNYFSPLAHCCCFVLRFISLSFHISPLLEHWLVGPSTPLVTEVG